VTNLLVRAALMSFLAVALPGSLAATTTAVAAQGCKPVPGKDLEQFYPSMPGWTRGEPSSETDISTMRSPFGE